MFQKIRIKKNNKWQIKNKFKKIIKCKIFIKYPIADIIFLYQLFFCQLSYFI